MIQDKIPDKDTLEHASSYNCSVSALIASSIAPSIVSGDSLAVSFSVIPSPFVSPIRYYFTYNIKVGHAQIHLDQDFMDLRLY